ncbi:hypothetical protein G9A89_020861 [Geosiphon pyriformis]|nr:hypothetical protein G9A89_020861 [Geosiphon pyriformis]
MIDSAQKKIIDENSLIETPKKIIPPRIEIIPAIENISKNSPPTITQPLASNDLSQLGTSAHRFSFNQKKHGTHKKLQKKNSQKLDKNNSSLPLNIPLSWKSLSQWQKSEGIPVDMVIRQGRAEQQKNYLSNLYGSLVLPKVYLGSRLAATDKDWLEEHNITHILTVADGLRPAFPKEYTYKVIQVRDSQNQNLLEHFDSCHRFIDKTLSQEKGNLLIHCPNVGFRYQLHLYHVLGCNQPKKQLKYWTFVFQIWKKVILE